MQKKPWSIFGKGIRLGPVCRMASAAVISPARQRATTRSKLSGRGIYGRCTCPCSLAMAIPSRWRWRIYSRSSSATAANTVSINFPVGVVVSIASLRLTNSTCFSVSRSTRSKQVARVSRKAADRLYDYRIAAADVLHHMGEFWSIGILAAGLVDENFVNAELAQPTSCRAVFCSSVLTRIYPIFMVYLSFKYGIMKIIRTVTLMDKTIRQVKQLAHRYGVPKLVLFGSRARGDYRAR